MASFALGIALFLVALYAPGLLFFRALRFTRLHALVAAPLFGACLYGVLPIAYYELGIPCTVASTFGVALATGAAAWLIARACARGRQNLPGSKPAFGLPIPPGLWKDASSPREATGDWALLGLYLLCGIVIGCLVFAGNLSSPDAPYIRYDNQTHLNVSKAFLDTGMWSSLHPSRYLDIPADLRPTVSGGTSFYPALLYALTALCALLASLKVTAAFNAVLFALCFVVFPAGMFAVMRTAFPGNRLAVALGAVAAVAFAAFPWGVFVRGLFPNAAGICLMAPALGSTMALLAHRPLAPAVPRGVVLWAVALPAVGLAQPNAVFGAFLFLAAYAAHVAGDRAAAGTGRRLPEEEPRHATATAGNGTRATRGARTATRRRIAAIAAVAAIALVLWLVALNLPALHSVVHYFGNSIQGPGKVIRRTLLLRFDPFQGQWLLALVVAVGAVACLRRKVLWLLFPAAWMGIAYIVIRTGNTPPAHFLAGFWYCDHVRIAAFYSVFLMPVAALGLAAIARGVWNLAGRVPALARPLPHAALPALAIALCIAVIFWPNVSAGDDGAARKTGFGTVYAELHNMYCQKDDRVYGSDEQAFADKAREIAGDAIVLNYPADGSSFAYATNDLRVYYRTIKTKNSSDASKAIRKHLDEYASDPAVQAAVKAIDAQYLLKLDQGVPYEDGTWFRQFRKPQNWAGIDAVGDSTPGFTAVLAEGDMRLYRIDPL